MRPFQPIDALNRECFCLSLDRDVLALVLDSAIGEPGLSALVLERCPYVFAAQPGFMAAAQMRRMAEGDPRRRMGHSSAGLPVGVPCCGAADCRAGRGRPEGVFSGFDFHLDGGHLGLIEINTNVGGAMLNAVLARAQRACCGATGAMQPTLAGVATFEQRIVDMFHQ